LPIKTRCEKFKLGMGMSFKLAGVLIK